MFNFLKDVRGMSSGQVTGLLGALVLIVIAAGIAPSMFVNWTSSGVGVPLWLGTVMPVIIAGGLVFVIWRAVAK